MKLCLQKKEEMAYVRSFSLPKAASLSSFVLCGQIAQSVEQRTENPCVAGSIPVLATLAGRAYASPAFFILEHPCNWVSYF